MDSTNLRQVDEELAACLQAAQAAFEAEDSATLAEQCRRALELDAENPRAWELLAQFGGWDAKMHVMDVDFCVDSARHALELAPEGRRPELAATIYDARKKQVAHRLEDDMMMPSYTGAKRLHQTMADWLRLLQEIPNLGHGLLEGEVTLVDNLCLRSKMGLMPGDRLVYTAYASLNGKEPYGETFRKALSARMAAESAREDARRAELRARLAEREEAYRAWVRDASPAPAERERRLRDGLSRVEAELERLEGESGRGLVERQIAELERQRDALGRFKVFHRREVDARIAEARAKLEAIDAALSPARAPLEAARTRIREELHAVLP